MTSTKEMKMLDTSDKICQNCTYCGPMFVNGIIEDNCCMIPLPPWCEEIFSEFIDPQNIFQDYPRLSKIIQDYASECWCFFKNCQRKSDFERKTM